MLVTDRDRQIVRWGGVLGAAGAEDIMQRFAMGRTVAYRRLRVLVQAGLLDRARVLHAHPTLYVATRDGLAFAGLPQVQPATVGPASVRHWTLCARLAVVLEAAERGYRVWGEPQLRAAEHAAGHPIASATLGTLPDGRPRLRRPDLVLTPRSGDGLPVAIEVELTVKAARRLQAVCGAWARCRHIAGVRYYTTDHAAPAVTRAVRAAYAHDAITILSLKQTLEAHGVTLAA
jgi:hypothetical protein